MPSSPRAGDYFVRVLLLRRHDDNRQRKKPTWQNAQRQSTTSAYSLTNLPAFRAVPYLVIRNLQAVCARQNRILSASRRINPTSGQDQTQSVFRAFGAVEFTGISILIGILTTNNRPHPTHSVASVPFRTWGMCHAVPFFFSHSSRRNRLRTASNGAARGRSLSM
jgi:hypothetical protein